MDIPMKTGEHEKRTGAFFPMLNVSKSVENAWIKESEQGTDARTVGEPSQPSETSRRSVNPIERIAGSLGMLTGFPIVEVLVRR